MYGRYFEMTKNNMYPWVDKTRNFIGGKCPHNCSYCYVKSFKYPILRKLYSGKPCLFEHGLEKSEGLGKTIFVQSCGDLFAYGIPSEWLIEKLEKFTEVKLKDNLSRLKEVNNGST